MRRTRIFRRKKRSRGKNATRGPEDAGLGYTDYNPEL